MMPRTQAGSGGPSNEPVMALVVGLVAAVLGLLAAFGVDLTAEQTAAIGTFVVAALGFGLWVRSKVTPTRKLPGAGEEGLSLVEVLVVLLIVVVLLLAFGVLP